MSKLLRCLCALLLLCLTAVGRAQSSSPTQAATATDATSSLAGIVSDPSGAKVPRAAVHIQSARAGTTLERDTTTDASGRFSLPLPPGPYNVTILAPGFDAFVVTVNLARSSSNRPLVDARLVISTGAETVNVAADTEQTSTSATDNKSALVFKKSQLDAFSDDDDVFQQQLLALAGSGDPQSPPQIFVDGFSNGRFPPKTSIREIRINSNPYSAQYESRGDGRVEIFTKPGADSLHGFLALAGNDNAFNSTDPYAGAAPPYHLFLLDSNINGPLNKKTSFFLGAEYHDQQNNAVVNAITGLDAAGNSIKTIQAIAAPQLQQTYSLRIDRQVTATNTLSGRFEFNRTRQTNSGVGLLTLASEGVNSTSNTSTLQLVDTQLLGAKMVAETRLQYTHATSAQSSVSNAPTIVVQGAFNGGGSSTQAGSDRQDRMELQEYISRQQGAHFLRFGGRYRFTHETNSSQANFNGQFTFPNIQAYQQAISTGIGATQFTLTTGQPSATLLLQDFALYAEDEWKLRPNLTVDLGFRFESQNAIPDHADAAPRLGIAWAAGQTEKKPAIVTLRSGGGIFYDRFTTGSLLTTLHQNGIAETSYYVANPGYFCATLTAACPSQASLSAITPTVYRVSPSLHTEYSMATGLTAERDLWKKGSITLNYAYIRVVHLYQSANINAPLPGTYNPALPTSGVRPFGGTQNIYEFQSNGVSNINRLFASLNLNPTKRLFLWAFAVLRDQKTDTSGAGSFPSNSYRIAADYGRPSQPTRRLFTGGNLELPLGINLNYFLSASSATPFNITTGTDLNGDTQYNDRPSFATAASPSASVVQTRYGTFNTNPQPGETIIPINYGLGPAFATADLGLGRNFKFGPRPPAPSLPPGAPVPKDPQPRPAPRFSLSFAVDASNVFNHVNAGPPVGVLSSPFFGHSISLNSPFGGTAASANRVITLRTFFEF